MDHLPGRPIALSKHERATREPEAAEVRCARGPSLCACSPALWKCFGLPLSGAIAELWKLGKNCFKLQENKTVLAIY